MSGSAKQEVRLTQALAILSMLVRCYAKTYHDPQELESIGYVWIATRLHKRCRNWPGFVRIGLCNLFRNEMRKQKRRRNGKVSDYIKKCEYRRNEIEKTVNMRVDELEIHTAVSLYTKGQE